MFKFNQLIETVADAHDYSLRIRVEDDHEFEQDETAAQFDFHGFLLVE